MNDDRESSASAEISPVGWYVGSYLLRFVEIDEPGNDEPDARFLAWENTVIVRARDLEEAFRKIELLGMQHTEPYRGGSEGVPVRWLFEGITELLPIYEPLEDGAEIMWEEHDAENLRSLRERSLSLEQIQKRYRRDGPGAR